MLQNLSYNLVEKGFPQWCCGSPTGLCKPRQLDSSAGFNQVKMQCFWMFDPENWRVVFLFFFWMLFSSGAWMITQPFSFMVFIYWMHLASFCLFVSLFACANGSTFSGHTRSWTPRAREAKRRWPGVANGTLAAKQKWKRGRKCCYLLTLSFELRFQHTTTFRIYPQ